MKFSRRKFFEIMGFGGIFILMTPGVMHRVEGLPLRPPGSLPEKHFLLKCIRCFRCGQVCPTGAVQFTGWQSGRIADTPILAALKTNPCTLCMECTKVCPSGAIKSLQPTVADIKNNVKIGIAKLEGKKCVLINGKRRHCHICLRVCPLNGEAIYLDSRGWPQIDSKVCVGCGLCEQACPLAAITVRGASNE